MPKNLSRRAFLDLLGLGAAALALESCRPRVIIPVTATPPGESNPVIETDVSRMVLVDGGSFRMGSTEGERDERPVHEVTLTRSFYLATHLVTFDQYDQFCADTGKTPPDDQGHGRGDLPVFGLNWYDATEYCNWLSRAEGLPRCYSGEGPQTGWNYWAGGYRLPTEAEWEYAALGGLLSRGYTYAGSNDPDQIAWYASNSGGHPHPVGQKEPNELGLYDMTGNVWEFCWDWYAWNYYIFITPPDDPIGADSVQHPNKSLRGGSFESDLYDLRLARRNYDLPVATGNYGIRLARTA